MSHLLASATVVALLLVFPRMSAAQQHDKVKVSSYDPVSRAAVAA